MRLLPYLTSVAAAAALAAAPARAQFQPVVMKVPAWRAGELVSGRWSGAAGSDLLVLSPGGSGGGRLVHHGNLLTTFPSPYAPPAAGVFSATGWFDASSTGSVPDSAWGQGTGVSVSWSKSISTYVDYPGLFADIILGMAPIRLFDRPQPLLLVTSGPIVGSVTRLYATDLAASASPAPPPAPPSWALPLNSVSPDDADPRTRLQPIRLSPGARSRGVDDVIVPLQMGFFLLWHDSAPTATTLDVSTMGFGVNAPPLVPPILPSAFLPPGVTMPQGSCLGAAAVDIDGDGVPDLVFSYGLGLDLHPPGLVLWIRNTGVLTDMAAQHPWGSLMGCDDFPITDAGTLRQLDLGPGVTAFAVHDRTLEQILVVRGDGKSGFEVHALPVPGVSVREMVALDVVGSPAMDLVALVDLPPNFTTSEVWIFPDDGDAAPSLVFRPALPAEALRGVDLPLAVDASDPDSPFSLTWIRPSQPDVAGPSTLTVPGTELCGPATTADVRVRVLDDLGVYVEVAGSVPIAVRPSLRLSGATPPGRLVLAPGGVAARAEGEAWPACGGSPAFTWGVNALGGLFDAPLSPGFLGAAAWREFSIPESAYPEALSGAPALTLHAVDGAVSGTATLPLELDASGLVSATVTFDRAAAQAGEVATARVQLASRIAVPLPAIRASIRLAGLAFAGAMTVDGAPATVGPEAGRVVIDPLPAAGESVEIVVPVRSLGAPGAIAVELFSAGGFRLSPESAPSAATPPIGCGCGVGGDASVLLLAAVIAFRRRRPT